MESVVPVDLEHWPRKELFDFFSGMSNPFYMVTFRQDVTEVYQYAKRMGVSFYYTLVWLCTEAINDVDAFHYAVLDGTLVRLPRREPSFTDRKPGADQFHIVTMDCGDGGPAAFCREAARKSAAQQTFLDQSSETENLIYFSCLPWVDLTGFVNERDLSTPESRQDSIPRLTWGKYVEAAGRKTLGLSVEVNHAFVDGLHIGQFAAALERRIRQLPERDVRL